MKKGFTLIELLAVILILGIIALIAIPTVTNMIEEAKRGALRSTAFTLVKQAEQTCTSEIIKNEEPTLFYTITNGRISKDINVKNLPKSGQIEVDNSCKSKVAISDGKYCVITDGDTVDFKDDATNCVLNNVVYTADKCFTVSNNEITHYNFNDEDCNTNTIVIPDTINGQAIKSIGSYTFRFEDPNDMYNYLIPSNVTLFDLSNMKHLETLKYDVFAIGYNEVDINNFEVKLPNNGTLKTIQSGAFMRYRHNLELPEGITTIGDSALYEINTSTLTLPSTITSLDKIFGYSTIPPIIINKSSRAFNWRQILNASSCSNEGEFVTGTCNTYNSKVVEIRTS